MNTNNLFDRIYLIHGNQQLLIEETTNRIIDKILEGREHDWSLERFNMEEMLKSDRINEKNRMYDLLVNIETLPMLSDVKVIQIDNFDLIKKPPKKNDPSLISKLYQAIENVIKKPPHWLWFVFTSKVIREQDFSKPLYKIIKDDWYIQKFVAYENNSPYNWVLERAKKKGIQISGNITRLIIDIVGNDLSDLDQELEKMSLYLNGQNITEDLIKKTIRGHKHFSIFRMTEALSQKELLQALEILDNQLKANPNEHFRLFALIVLQFRRLLIIHCMLKQFHKENEILHKLSLPTFLGKKLLEQAKNFTREEIQNIYFELSNLDLKIKFNRSLAPLLLKDLFQRICSDKLKNTN